MSPVVNEAGLSPHRDRQVENGEVARGILNVDKIKSNSFQDPLLCVHI